MRSAPRRPPGYGSEGAYALLAHQQVGASWEGFVIEQVLATQAHDDAWFWSVHQGAEIDLLLRRGDKLYGVEVVPLAELAGRDALFSG